MKKATLLILILLLPCCVDIKIELQPSEDNIIYIVSQKETELDSLFNGFEETNITSNITRFPSYNREDFQLSGNVTDYITKTQANSIEDCYKLTMYLDDEYDLMCAQSSRALDLCLDNVNYTYDTYFILTKDERNEYGHAFLLMEKDNKFLVLDPLNCWREQQWLKCVRYQTDGFYENRDIWAKDDIKSWKILRDFELVGGGGVYYALSSEK